MSVDPTTLGIFERLDKYPDSYTDEDLLDLLTRYEGQTLKGRNATIPIKAFLILEEREKARSDDYTKEEK